ncbi:DUF4262 domain-containing protein [Flavobacterium sp. XS2P12]|uniref:DUF4262 domain-containing protein n=1 Tax=Flavobacterium melibiosi TaxID=3398734 RepID=UPI003A86D41E
MTNSEFLDIIKTNIYNNGYHLTLVNGGQHPEFSYSIGLTEKLGFELVIAGGFISIKENESIFKYVYQQLQAGSTLDSQFLLSDNNIFCLTKVDSSWCKKLMLGVYDYYNLNEITAYQIIPVNRTMDTPLMAEPIISNDPIWKWLDMDWNIKVPKNSYAITDIDSLKGKTIVELMRWEDHVWEMFSGPGPDFKEEDIRIVPLGTILGIDDTLQRTVNLPVGKGLWRENKDSEWNDWE